MGTVPGVRILTTVKMKYYRLAYGHPSKRWSDAKLANES